MSLPGKQKGFLMIGCLCRFSAWELCSVRILRQEPYPNWSPTHKSMFEHLQWTILMRRSYRCQSSIFDVQDMSLQFLVGWCRLGSLSKRMVHTFSYWGHFLGHRDVHGGLCSAVTLEKDSSILNMPFSLSSSFHHHLESSCHQHLIRTDKPNVPSKRECKEMSLPGKQKGFLMIGCLCRFSAWELCSVRILRQEPYPNWSPTHKSMFEHLQWTILIRRSYRCQSSIFDVQDMSLQFLVGWCRLGSLSKRMVHTFSYCGHFLGHRDVHEGLCSAVTLEKDSSILNMPFSLSSSFHRHLVHISMYHRYHLYTIDHYRHTHIWLLPTRLQKKHV